MLRASTFKDAFTDALRMWEEGERFSYIVNRIATDYDMTPREAEIVTDLVGDTVSKFGLTREVKIGG